MAVFIFRKLPKQAVTLPIGSAISDQKKLFRGRRNRRNNWFVPSEFRLFRGTENSRNSVPNRSAENKNARNSVPWNKNWSKLSEFHSEPCLGQKYAVYSVCWGKIFCKTNFFHAIFRASELILPKNLECLGSSTSFLGITEAIPCLFRWIFSEWNSVANHSSPLNPSSPY